jgi:para-aminobenzoate synthetase component 1
MRPGPSAQHNSAGGSQRAWTGEQFRSSLLYGPSGLRHACLKPVTSLVVPAGDIDRIAGLAETVDDWLNQGATLVVGALAYDAGAALNGLGPGQSDEGPLAVLTAFAPDAIVEAEIQDADGWQLRSPFSALQERGTYISAIEQIRAYLLAGDCYQTNLSQCLTATFAGDPLAIWQRLIGVMQPPFGGYLEWPGGALLSASPERFLSVHQGRVVTEPIKGSRPRSRDPAIDRELASELSRSRKDRAENLMIVDLLRNDLGKVCRPGSIGVDEFCRLRSFSNVHHLVSRISGTLRAGVRPLDALLACFPGGSITGAPKRRAMEIIQELEPVPRGFYCGSLFWQDAHGNFDSNILIRTLQARTDGTLLCHGGGGIVADSDPDDEYEESLFKIRALMEIVGA